MVAVAASVAAVGAAAEAAVGAVAGAVAGAEGLSRSSGPWAVVRVRVSYRVRLTLILTLSFT